MNYFIVSLEQVDNYTNFGEKSYFITEGPIKGCKKLGNKEISYEKI